MSRRIVQGGVACGSPRRAPVARTIAALLALAAPLLLGGCLTAPATSEARRVADLYTVFMAIAGVVVVIVLGLATFAIVRYRRRPGDDELPPQTHGSLPLEVAWTGIPLATIVVLLVLTVLVLNVFDSAAQAAAGAEIRVNAFRWGWRFEYPDQGVVVEGVREPGPEVYVPVGENVKVTLTSSDVDHAFYVPRFLFKRDAIPGRESVFAFTVDEPGRYGGQCAEFCGIYHSQMPFTIVAVPRTEYEAWLAAHAQAEGGP